jgi:hypothetical protein
MPKEIKITAKSVRTRSKIAQCDIRSVGRNEVTMATGLVFPSAMRFANGGAAYSAVECRQDLRLTAAEIWLSKFDEASCRACIDAVDAIFGQSIKPFILRGSAAMSGRRASVFYLNHQGKRALTRLGRGVLCFNSLTILRKAWLDWPNNDRQATLGRRLCGISVWRV